MLSRILICLAVVGLFSGPPVQAQQSIWDPAGIKDFSLTDANGGTVTKETLAGKEWVVGFIFTRCKGPCPTVIGQSKILQDQTGVTMVTISVQPEVDTPDVLRNFSHEYVAGAKPDAKGNVPKWYWLTGDRKVIYDLIIKSFKMPVGEVQTQKDGLQIIHSNNLMHVDETGKVLGKYNALEPSEMALLRRILQGKDPRGKMATSAVPKPAGEVVEVEGAKEAGLTFIRQPSEEETTNAETGDQAAPEVPDPNIPPWVYSLPAVNASLNGLATVLLVTGYVLIKLKHARSHKLVMLSSFATSIIFLGSYLIYHYYVGSKRFPGTGTIKTVYLVILITHVFLAAAVPFLASMTIYRAFRGQWDKHKRIARITFPIWVYVSVTGVVIYVMLYQWPVAA